MKVDFSAAFRRALTDGAQGGGHSAYQRSNVMGHTLSVHRPSRRVLGRVGLVIALMLLAIGAAVGAGVTRADAAHTFPAHDKAMAYCMNDFYGHRVDVYAPTNVQNIWQGLRWDGQGRTQTFLGGRLFWTAGVRSTATGQTSWAPWLMNPGGGSPAVTGTLWQRQQPNGSYLPINGTVSPVPANDMDSAGAAIALGNHGSYEIWGLLYWENSGLPYHYDFLGYCS
jgi:hypothetical protein